MTRNMNILLVAYYFPPTGGGGVVRNYQTAKILADSGHSVTVITTNTSHYDVIDNSLVSEVHKSEINVIRIKQLRDYFKGRPRNNVVSSSIKNDRAQKSFLKIKVVAFLKKILRLLLDFVPDSTIDWYFPVIFSIRKMMDLSEYDLVITSSPPEPLHFIGSYIKRRNKQIYWVCDFRDLWVENSYSKNRSKIWKHLNNQYEKRVVDLADQITCTSINSTSIMKTKYPYLTQKFFYHPNGYWSKDISHFEPIPADRKFRLLFAGRFYKERVNKNLFLALHKVILSHPEVEFDIIGPPLPSSVSRIIEQYGLKDTVNYHGYVSRGLSISMQKSSEILVNIESSAEAVPGKIFEYFGTDKIILHIGNEYSASTRIMQGYENAMIVEDEIDNIYEAIIEVVEGRKKAVISKYKEKYEREYLIKEYLKSIL